MVFIFITVAIYISNFLKKLFHFSKAYRLLKMNFLKKNELLRETVSFRDRWILENIWSVTFIFQKRLSYSS